MQGNPVDSGNADLSLICRAHGKLCALPLEYVIETMRPLPIEAFAGAPRFVQGVAVIRGVPVPVVDAGRLLGETDGPHGRFVTLAVGTRCVALAVESVQGVRVVPAGSRHALPPLLQEGRSDLVAAIGLLDAELLLVLQSSRLLSNDDWAALDLLGSLA
jgi:purine-binding chemotaxis protein CheW